MVENAQRAAEVPAGASSKGRGGVERLAWLLDDSIRLPGGYRVGLDGVLGLIPGVGDAIGAALSLYIVSRAAAAGVPKAVLARMLLNVGADSLLGAVPVLGDLFDLGFKANRRNAALMARYAADATRVHRVSWLVILAVVAVVVLFGALVVALGILLARAIVAAI